MRSLKMLDLVHSFETHNIGVVYVGPDQVIWKTDHHYNSCCILHQTILNILGHSRQFVHLLVLMTMCSGNTSFLWALSHRP